MTPSLKVDYARGPAAVSRAWRFWRTLSPRQRRAALWMHEAAAITPALLARILRAPLAFGQAADRDVMLAWLVPTADGSRSAAIHFMCGNTAAAARLALGREFLAQAGRLYDLVYAVLPMPWRGARAYCRALGFAEVLRLPRACRLADRGRNVDGLFMSRNCLGMRRVIPGRSAELMPMEARMGKQPHKVSRTGMLKMRRCHDCGRPTWNFRCEACWRKLRGGDPEDEPPELDSLAAAAARAAAMKLDMELDNA